MTTPATSPVNANDHGDVARALAAAFVGDPVWQWLTRDRHADFAAAARPFFEVEVKHFLHLGGAWTTEDAHAGALWAPPKRWKATLRDVAQLAPPSVRLFRTGLVTALSALTTVEKKHPTEPHWYLGFLGTDPAFQGKGYGSAVLQPVLDRCDREGVPAYLESSKEGNVPFYERHGFTVTETHDFKGGPRMWLMWREPQVPDPAA